MNQNLENYSEDESSIKQVVDNLTSKTSTSHRALEKKLTGSLLASLIISPCANFLRKHFRSAF